MIAKDNLPIDTTEKEGFKYFIQGVAPLYKVPGRHRVTSLIEDKYHALSNIIKKELSRVSSLCITCDVWTEVMSVTSLLGITVHYLDNQNYKSVCIGVKELSYSHTAQYLGQSLLSVCTERKIDITKISAVITDNAANIVKRVTDTFKKNKHLPCFAHILNLVAVRITEEAVIKPIIDKKKVYSNIL